jgi:hypothetical protein
MDDSWLEIGNSAAELALRAIAIARKNDLSWELFQKEHDLAGFTLNFQGRTGHSSDLLRE